MASRVPVYRGAFGRKEAERLLWRVGFGPRPGEAARVARKGLKRAVDDLVYPSAHPGERSKTLRLIRGRYRVWCAIAGHRDWGMRGTLRVVPRR